jgi:hypothetical protein
MFSHQRTPVHSSGGARFQIENLSRSVLRAREGNVSLKTNVGWLRAGGEFRGEWREPLAV